MLGNVYIIESKDKKPKKPVAMIFSKTPDNTPGQVADDLGRSFWKCVVDESYQLVPPQHIRLITAPSLYRFTASDIFKLDYAGANTVSLITDYETAEAYCCAIAKEDYFFNEGSQEVYDWADHLAAKTIEYVDNRKLKHIRFKDVAKGADEVTFERIFKEVVEAYFAACADKKLESGVNVYADVESMIDTFLSSEGGGVARDIKNERQRECCRRYLLTEYALFYFLVRDYAAVLYSGKHAEVLRSSMKFHGANLYGEKFNVDKFLISREELIPTESYKKMLQRNNVESKHVKCATREIHKLSEQVNDKQSHDKDKLDMIESKREVNECKLKLAIAERHHTHSPDKLVRAKSNLAKAQDKKLLMELHFSERKSQLFALQIYLNVYAVRNDAGEFPKGKRALEKNEIEHAYLIRRSLSVQHKVSQSPLHSKDPVAAMAYLLQQLQPKQQHEVWKKVCPGTGSPFLLRNQFILNLFSSQQNRTGTLRSQSVITGSTNPPNSAQNQGFLRSRSVADVIFDRDKDDWPAPVNNA